MTTVYPISEQPIHCHPMPTNIGVGPLTQNFSKLCIEDQEKTRLHEGLQRLFTVLRDVNSRLYQKSLRSLVQACEERGVEHLLTVKQLDLSHCELTEVPPEVGLLTGLQRLLFINNQLTDLPLSLYALADNLRSLNLAGNRLTSLPAVVHQIATKRITEKKHFDLFLRGNPMDEVPKSLKPVTRSLPHNYSYFR